MESKNKFLILRGFLLIVVLFVLFSGCGVDFNNGKRPNDYMPSKWVSKEPEMWFEVGSEYKKWRIDGYLEEQSMEVFFNRGKSIHILIDGSIIFSGLCVFRPDKFTITVDEERDKIFNGKYKKITFVREP